MPRPLVIRVKEVGGNVRTLHVRPGLSFGRARENVCQILDTSVSRTHALIVLDGEQWLLQEISATNPVRIVHNGREFSFGRVKKYPIEPGVVFYLGRVACEVCDSDGAGMVRTERVPSPGAAAAEEATVASDRPGLPLPVVPSLTQASATDPTPRLEPEERGSLGTVKGSTPGVLPARAGDLTVPAPSAPAARSARPRPVESVSPPVVERPPDPREAPAEEVPSEHKGLTRPSPHRSTTRSRATAIQTRVEDLQRANPKLVLAHAGLERIIALREHFRPGDNDGYVCILGRDANLIGDDELRVDQEIKHSVVSNPHAALIFKWGRFFVMDLKSKNGTTIRGRKEGGEYRLIDNPTPLDPNVPVELSAETYLNFGETVDALFYTETDESGAPVDKRIYPRALEVLVTKGKLNRQQRREVLERAQRLNEEHLGAALLIAGYLGIKDWFQACQVARVLGFIVSSTPRWLWWVVSGFLSLLVLLLVLLIILISKGS